MSFLFILKYPRFRESAGEKLWYHMQRLVTRNIHVKYENPISFLSFVDATDADSDADPIGPWHVAPGHSSGLTKKIRALYAIPSLTSLSKIHGNIHFARYKYKYYLASWDKCSGANDRNVIAVGDQCMNKNLAITSLPEETDFLIVHVYCMWKRLFAWYNNSLPFDIDLELWPSFEKL